MMSQHGMLAGRLIGSFVIFQGIPTSIAKEPYIFFNFPGGGGEVGVRDSLSHPLDLHML